MNLKWLVLGGMCWIATAQAAIVEEKTTNQADQVELALTIYNDDLALVKDQRKVNLTAQINRLAWRDVSARIRPETALLRSLSEAAGLRLIEQNFDFDVLTPQKLLEKNVGNAVTVIKTNPVTGLETRETATVLSANAGVVLKFADRIETGVPGRLAFASVPDNLRDRPTLVMTVDNARAGGSNLELSYLTGGLSWRTDYVAELSANEDRMDINAWVTLTNQSGVSYPNARLQFVAGDVNRVMENLREDTVRSGVMLAQAAKAPVAQENLFEYHLYSLARTTTLGDQQTKQVALLSAAQIPVRKSLEFRGVEYYYQGSYGDLGKKLKAGVYIEFENKGAGLGVPLPKGIIRLYKKDKAGNAQFVGEDTLDHTAKNETVRLKLGDAFDVYAEKKQTDFQKVSAGRNTSVYESAYQIDVHNAKSEAVMVKLFEPVPGDWQVITESAAHTKPNANTALWQLRIPAESNVVLTYRVRVRI